MRKHLNKLFLLVIVVLFLLTGSAISVNAFFKGNGIDQDNTVQEDAEKKEKLKYKEGELILKFREGATKDKKEKVHKKFKSKKLKEFKHVGIEVIELDSGLSVEDAVDLYNAEPDVEYAEPNIIFTALETVPNDFFFNNLWGLKNTGQTGGTPGADIGATLAWDITTGDSSLVVVVIDTGVDYTHEDLALNMWTNPGEIPDDGIDNDENGYIDDIHGIDAINSDGDPMDDNGHGTHCSGTVGGFGDNSIGVAGVNWDIQIMGCKFIGSGGSGPLDAAIECLDYVTFMKDVKGVNVIATSNSWGCWGSEGCYSQALYDAIDRHIDSDILFIAAAANQGQDNENYIVYPANYNNPNLIAVAATDHNDTLAYFSDYGRRSVDVGAPGVDIFSTFFPFAHLTNSCNDDDGDGYGYCSGTSMATPHVSGLAGLIKAGDPNRDWRDIKNLILSAGDSIVSLEGLTVTGKRINANGSLSCIDSPVFSVLEFPADTADYQVGIPAILSALSINCESAVGPVTVTPSQDPEFELYDDGIEPDVAPDDGIFTGEWTPTLPTDTLTFSSPSGFETIDVPLYHDLVMTEVTGPSAGETGEPITVTNTVLNQGVGDVRGIFDVCIYLSDDDVITTGDVLLGSRAVVTLAAGSESTADTEVTIPAGITSNDYYIGVVADCNDAVDELDETNNGLQGNLITISEVYSDLTVTLVSGPPVAQTDDQITVTTTVSNQGNGKAWQNFMVGIYLSTDATITTADKLISTRNVAGLAAGMVNTADVTAAITPDIAGGTYYLGAIADYDNVVINESDTGNNAREGNQIVITKLYPDLVVNVVSGPLSAVSNELITVTTTVKNQGAGSASGVYAGIYLSTDATITTGDIYLGQRNIGSLAAGGENTVDAPVSIPTSVVTDTYYIGAIADHNNTLEESDENNNGREGNLIDITQQLPDLTVTAVSGTAVGDQLSVTITVKNQGVNNSGAFYTGTYLSTDATITTDDTYVGIRFLAGLAPDDESTFTTDYPIPVTLGTGDYYVGAITDSINSVAESDEDNNSLAGNQITVAKDLIVTTVSAEANGDLLTVTATVKNQGSNATRTFYTGTYLSTDVTITTDDTYVGLWVLGSLAPGEETTFTTDYAIPSTMDSGDYYVGAIADYNNIVEESDENNNFLAGNQITIAKDLIVTAVSGVANGDQLTVTVTTKNQGNNASGSSLTGIYLSLDTTITTADTYIGLRSEASRAPGEETTFTADYTIPSSMDSGDYYVGAIADYNNIVEETDENNNFLAGNQITIAKDLIVTAVSGVANGDQLTVTVTTKNQGNNASGSSLTGIYLSLDTTITTADTYIGLRSEASRAPGEETTFTADYTIPSSMDSGDYYVGAIADYNNSVEESDENNNFLAGNQITIAKDLIVTAVSGVANGDQLTVTVTTKNQGNNASGSSLTGIYLSLDTTITTADTYIGLRSEASRAPGEETTFTADYTIPSSMDSGDYYVGAIADYNNSVEESDENNNFLAGNQITIAKDLIVTVVSGVANGDQLTVTVTTKNQGNNASGSSLTGIYLSLDTTITTADTYIGLRSEASRAPGEETTFTADYTIPSSVDSGDYYVGAIADYNNSVEETDENNNFLAGNQITIAKDLIVTAVSGVANGDQLTVTVTTKNQGNNASGSSLTGIYLSLDTTITTADTYIGLRSEASRAPGEETTFTADYTIPSSMDSGDYYVGAIADYNNIVEETDENNNFLAGNQITIAKDLIVTAVSPTIDCDQLTVTVTVRNQGTNSSGSFLTRIYLSQDSTITTADTYIGLRSLGSLAPDTETTFTDTYTIPLSLGSGMYYVGVIVDYNNGVVETDETNNSGSNPISISYVNIITSSLSFGTVGVPYSQIIDAAICFPPGTWSITAGNLPDGLTLNSSTGEISGTPGTPETFTFTVEVSGINLFTDSKQLSIDIYNPCSDNDGDGYGSVGGNPTCPNGLEQDCDDINSEVNPGAGDSNCDGVDDNCSGTADDEYIPTATSCGDGVCAASGQLECQGGIEVNTCTPGSPTEDPEQTCTDSNDNDCDGLIDFLDTDCGPPDCSGYTRKGDCNQDANCKWNKNQRICEYHCTVTETPEVTCNDGFDNDCDGLFDNADADCVSCTPTGNPDDNCDGIDDDCNGIADDAYVPTQTNCGTGECAASGQLECQGGTEVDTCSPGSPQTEGPEGDQTCTDSLDNDCDGDTDILDADCVCIPTGNPDDNCDGIDDDCNGTADDAYVSAATNCGIGECAATGQLQCQGGTEVDTCSPGSPQTEGPPGDPTCSDGLDNDCDTHVDGPDPDCEVVPPSCSDYTNRSECTAAGCRWKKGSCR